MNSTSPTYGPLNGHAEVDDIVASLRAAGVQRRSLGVVDLRRRPGVERDPLARWALSTIWRETLRIVLVSLPILVWVNFALLMFTLADRPSLALGIGVAAGVGASPGRRPRRVRPGVAPLGSSRQRPCGGAGNVRLCRRRRPRLRTSAANRCHLDAGPCRRRPGRGGRGRGGR